MPLNVAARWFETERYADGVTLIWEPHVRLGIRCNIWHVQGRDRDLLIDSGMGVAPLREVVSTIADRPLLCVASHSHFDHIGGHHEFAERAIHPAEAEILSHPTAENTLIDRYIDDRTFLAAPYENFDPCQYAIRPAPPTLLLREAEIIDLGDRHFEVLHLPGHSPGSIGLWEAGTGIFFSGDVVYDGELYDNAYHSVVEDYVRSVERLRTLPVKVVHGGHRASFGRERLLELVDEYQTGKRKPGCPD